MSKLKNNNSEKVEGGLSSRTGSFTTRFLALTGSAALLVGGAGSVLIGASAASATAYAGGLGSVTSTYVIGASTAAPTVSILNNKGGVSTTYTVGMTVPAALSANNDSITLNFTQGGVTGASIQDISSGAPAVVVPSTSITVVTGTNGSVTLKVPANYAAGDKLQIVLNGVTNPTETSATTLTLTAQTSQSAVSGSASYTIAANATSGPAVTASSYVPSQSGVTYTLTNFKTTAAPVGTLKLTSGDNTTVWPTNVSQYTLVDTTTGKTISGANLGITNVSNASGVATITYSQTSYTIASGDVLSLTVTGVQNGSSTSTKFALDANGATLTTGTDQSNSVSFGTSITGVTASASSLVAGNSANYTIGFKATTALPNTGTITLTEPGGLITLPSSTTGSEYVVTDTTTGQSASVSATSGSSLAGVVITPGFAIGAGDSVTVQVFGVTNGTTVGAVSDLTVATITDTVAVAAPQLTLVAAAPTGAFTVTDSVPSAGATGNYSVTGVTVKTAFATGDKMDLEFANGTTSAGSFPSLASDYSITDLTNSTYSETPSFVNVTNTTGAVNLTLSNALPAGDNISISISGVINGSAALYTATLDAQLEATPPVVFPTAAVSYPNGAFVQSSGQIDVIAGGYGFGIPTAAVYAQIAANDASTVVDGTFPTATAPRAGTLIQVAGSAGIWVVGTDGKLYQFSTPAQFLGDGYSPMQVVTVPSAGGLTVGTGTPPSAALTMADGSIQNFGGTLYVFDGGQAFGIPNLADAAAIIAATGATPIVGSGSAPMAGTIANGSVLTVLGTTNVYVTSGGTAYLATGTNLTTNGYTTMYAVTVPSLGSMPTM